MSNFITIAAFLLYAAGLVGSLGQFIPDLVAIPMLLPALAMWAIDLWRARA